MTGEVTIDCVPRSTGEEAVETHNYLLAIGGKCNHFTLSAIQFHLKSAETNYVPAVTI